MPSSSYAVAASSPSDHLPRSRIATTAPASTPPSGPLPQPGSSSAPSSQPAGYSRSPRLPAAGGGRFNSPNYSYGSASSSRIQQHITSAIAKGYSPQVVASSHAAPAERLPRTSSLLPPPRIIPNYTNTLADVTPVQEDFNSSSLTISSVPEAVNPREPKPKHNRKSSGPYTHSRSSSLGGLSDTLRTLNRWSSSTTSSRSPQRPERFSRRMSVEVLGRPRTGSVSNSPKRLQKSRPSTSGGSPRAPPSKATPQQQASPPHRGSPAFAFPAGSGLPPIRAFSPLEQQIRSEAASLAGTPQTTYTARPGLDDGGYFRDVFKRPGDLSTPAASHPASNGYASTPGADSPDVSTMPAPPQNGEARGHSRNRSQAAKSSADTSGSSRSRDRSRQPSQKAMLSRALQKANQAVQLDNAQSYQVARDSYQEACDILQTVLMKTAGDEDQKKLEAIRSTYSDRIAELDKLIPDGGPDQKALPARPKSHENYPGNASPTHDSGDEPIIETATVTRIVRDRPPDRPAPQVPSYSVPRKAVAAVAAAAAAGRRPGSRGGQSPAVGTSADGRFTSSAEANAGQSAAFSRQHPLRLDTDMMLQLPIQNEYMPPPLSPRRPPSRGKVQERNSPETARATAFPTLPAVSLQNVQAQAQAQAHSRPTRNQSQETTSWLDPIDESGGSTASSVHSRTSSLRVKRKHIRTASGDTEAEFDAALDDAIEAAYNDGYEPQENGNDGDETDPEESIAKSLRKVELARQRVRETEREALELANERERRLRAQLQMEEEETLAAERMNNRDKAAAEVGNESEEEERMLEEMTRGYAIEDFAFRAAQSKAGGVPRESDSSGLTSRTWHSSMGSNPPTASTVLSTLSESTVTPGMPKASKPPMPPPTGALPPQPGAKPGDTKENRLSVRNRRLSGQNAKQLKIETPSLGTPAQPLTAIQNPQPANAQAQGLAQSRSQTQTQGQPRTAGYIVQQRQALSAAGNKAAVPGFTAGRQGPSPAPGGISPLDGAPLSTPTLPQVAFPDATERRAGSPSVTRQVLRKNMSSSSLKSTKSRNLSVSNGDDGASDLSPGTPMSATMGSASRLPAVPLLPSGLAAGPYKSGSGNGSALNISTAAATATATIGGLHLFDMGFHSPTTPGSPDTLAPSPPAPLEPCPTDSLLRPFWLMRCLYQTLAHPRGGYLSARLFVPREAWRVRGVKLRGVDDKIAQCDVLSAALGRLARVDTCDADAVLEEMQALEGVLEAVQAALARRLGSGEVGVQGVAALFRDANPGLEVESGGGGAGVGGGAGPKGSGSGGAFSWRRLRSKGSSAGLGGGGGGGGNGKATTPIDGPMAAGANGVGGGAGSKDAPLLASLPMTSNPTSRPSKRDVGSVAFSGPNATYMAALARLFDAAQTVDQIARQVEDPGLRHADKTQVGLELCTRHAAEFFAFYVCRFVLGDLALLLDKYVKRASEWVLT